MHLIGPIDGKSFRLLFIYEILMKLASALKLKSITQRYIWFYFALPQGSFCIFFLPVVLPQSINSQSWPIRNILCPHVYVRTNRMDV